MRKPIAMGFYPHDTFQLEETVKNYLKAEEKIKNPLGVILPHAGYVFSGSVAGSTLKAAETEKKNFFILCPNHSGFGTDVGVGREDWQTLLGSVKVNKSIVDDLGIEISEGSHKYEHSAEVQLPFLQIMYKDFTIVPICLGNVGLDGLRSMAEKLADYQDSFYIASSDFIHFGPNYGYIPLSGSIEEQVKWAEKTDKELVEKICKLDAEGFYETVTENGYTVCGFIPITLLIMVMKLINAKQGRLIKYSSSYATHKNSSFVGYAGIVFE